MHLNHGIRRVIAATAAVLVTVSLAPAASAAPGPTTGLYGSADPTYDGVFRQSLAILGLSAVGVTPAPAAITWLLRQQCANGAFQAFRADPATPCAAADPVNFTGPDTNSTAMAAMALMAVQNNDTASPALVGRSIDAALRAGGWLIKQQRPDGGWPWTTGGASDANSTGLSVAAMLTIADSTDFPGYRKASRYLGALSSPCEAGGGIAYQAGGPANGLASAQALIGLSGTLPVPGPRRIAVAAPCANTAKAKAASYLARAMTATGTLPSSLGDGPDYSGTANAVIGLASARQGRAVVAKATNALKAAARTFALHSGGPDAGALGLLLLVSEATGAKPTNFGGINLVTTLTGSIRK